MRQRAFTGVHMVPCFTAYVYMFIEALSDGGVAAGLPRNVATQLVSDVHA